MVHPQKTHPPRRLVVYPAKRIILNLYGKGMDTAFLNETDQTEGRCMEIITQAEYIFLDLGPVVLADRELTRHLEDYDREIRSTRRLMGMLGTFSDCSDCAARTPGGCCGAGIEDWYEIPLLLANLLLGYKIPRVRIHDSCCLFLGENGCRLHARHDICVNYLCDRIKKRLSPPDLQGLMTQAGRELFAGWQMERRLRQLLKGRL